MKHVKDMMIWLFAVILTVLTYVLMLPYMNLTFSWILVANIIGGPGIVLLIHRIVSEVLNG
jgi:hypothetical protein